MESLYRILTFILVLLHTSSCTNTEQSCNSLSYSSDKIIINGNPNDKAWTTAPWKLIDQKWLGADYTNEDFNGRYKLVWDKDHLYVLAEVVDDILIDSHAEGLFRYWDDDCLEIFIDADASGGNHQYNNNAFAYHIGLDNRVVDLGSDSLPHYYDHIKCVRNTVGQKSIWELSITVYDDQFIYGQKNESLELTANTNIGFAIAYCDNDSSEERENFIGSAVIEGEDKNRGWIDADVFDKFTLVK